MKSFNTKPKKSAVKVKKASSSTKKSNFVTRALRRVSGMSKRSKIITAVLLVVVAFGGIGAWQVQSSKGLTYALSSKECYLRGRPYRSTDGACLSYCLSGAGYYNTNATYAYCTGALSTSISSSYCTGTLKRAYRSPGCTHRWQGTSLANAPQCYYSGGDYVAHVPYDYCTGGTTSGSTTTTTSGWTWPLPGYGVGNGYSTTKPHYGIDIPAPTGTAVKAAASGTLNWKGTISSACGKGIIIKVGSVYQVYQHIDFSSTISNMGIGGSIGAGTTVGYIDYVGSSYCWTGTHLHFGVQNTGGVIYDPTNFNRSGYFINPCNYFSNC